MKLKNVLLAIVIVSIASTLLFEVAEYLFGADNVFFGGLCLIPFLLVWCLLTDKELTRKDKTKGYIEL